MDVLPGKSARLSAARLVLWGAIAFASLEVTLHLVFAWYRGRPINWWYQLPTLGYALAAGLALRWLRQSLSRAMVFFAGVAMAGISVILFYDLETKFNVMDFDLFMQIVSFHIVIFALGLIVGFKPAIGYAVAISPILLAVGVFYVGTNKVFVPLVLAYAVALPARVVERLIEESTAEQARLNLAAAYERELDVARQLQVSLLPLDAPHVAGLDLAGWSQPAWQVGGDFYNYFVLDPGHIAIAVGDVSGKGLQSALMMALSLGLLITRVQREMAPAGLLAALNAALYAHTQRNNLNTALLYADLKSTREGWDLRVSNAGLVAPLVRWRDGRVEWLRARGLPLGTMEGLAYPEVQRLLRPGDVLILGSDGVVETMNEAGKLYGFERLADCVARAACPARAGDIQAHILADVRAFAGQAEAHDDVTLVVLVVGDAR